MHHFFVAVVLRVRRQSCFNLLASFVAKGLRSSAISQFRQVQGHCTYTTIYELPSVKPTLRAAMQGIPVVPSAGVPCFKSCGCFTAESFRGPGGNVRVV